MNQEQIVSQLGLAGAIIAATVYLLREIRKSQPPTAPPPLSPKVEEKPDATIRPVSHNGRVQRLEDKTDARFERIENKIESQTVQLDCLSKGQFETRSLVERQGGKLDAILEVLKKD